MPNGRKTKEEIWGDLLDGVEPEPPPTKEVEPIVPPEEVEFTPEEAEQLINNLEAQLRDFKAQPIPYRSMPEHLAKYEEAKAEFAKAQELPGEELRRLEFEKMIPPSMKLSLARMKGEITSGQAMAMMLEAMAFPFELAEKTFAAAVTAPFRPEPLKPEAPMEIRKTPEGEMEWLFPEREVALLKTYEEWEEPVFAEFAPLFRLPWTPEEVKEQKWRVGAKGFLEFMPWIILGGGGIAKQPMQQLFKKVAKVQAKQAAGKTLKATEKALLERAATIESAISKAIVEGKLGEVLPQLPLRQIAAKAVLTAEEKKLVDDITEGGSRLVEMPTYDEMMWDITQRFVGKPAKLIEKPVVRHLVGLVNPQLVARHPVQQIKTLEGRLRDVAQGATDIALRPVRVLAKPKVRKGVVVDARIKPKPEAPMVEGKPSMNIHDIAEYAERYDMPKELRAYFDEIRNVSRQTTAMLEKELAKFDIRLNKLAGESDWVYLHRVVERIGEVENLKMAGWRSMQKPRSLDLAGRGEQLLKPVKYLDDPVAELNYQIQGAYNWIVELRIKEALKKTTTTAKERVKPEVIEDLVNKNSIRIAADHLKKLISRAKRGEQLPAVSLNAVDRKFPEIGKKLRELVEAKPKVVPERTEFQLMDDLHKNIVRTRASAESTDAEVLGFAKGVLNLAERADIPARTSAMEKAIGDFGGKVIDKSQLLVATDTELSKLHKVIIELKPRVTPRVEPKIKELNVLAKQATKLLTTATEEFWAAKTIYQRALKQAGPTIEEGTTRYFGGRIFTTQELIKPGVARYKFDAKGFRFVPEVGRGKVILGRDLALEVDKQFGYHIPSIFERAIQRAGTLGGVLRETKASLDLSVQFIQTQLGGLGLDTWNLLTGRPSARWIKGAARGAQAAFMPQSYARWAGKSEIIAVGQEMARHRALIQVSEYTEALGVLAPLLRKTVIGKPAAFLYSRANAAFTAGRVSTATYMWMGERHLATKGLTGTALSQRLDELGQWVNKSTGVLSTRGMGINPTQRSLEAVFMFAPRYTRAVVASVTDIVRGGYTGAQAREALAGLITAGIAFFTFVPIALGQKPRLNPLPEGMGGDGAKWLTVKVGESYVGIGGTIYGLARLLANNWAVLTERPEDLFRLDMTNPNVRFVRAKFGPPLALGVDYVTGKGFLGNLTRENWQQVMGTALDWLIPIWVSGTIGEEWYDKLAEKEPLETHPEAALPEIIGMRTIPVTDYDKYMSLRDVYSRQDLSVPYRDIEDSADRDALFRNHPDLEELRKTVAEEFEKRGTEFERWYAENSRRVNEERNERMEVISTSLMNGQIDQREWRNQRNYTRPFYSGYKSALWDAREKFDERTVKSIEKYSDEQSQNDKALDKYQEIKNTPEIDPQTGLPDWEKREASLGAFMNTVSPEQREYIEAHKNDWVYDYDENTQKIERLFIDCESALDAYYALPEGEERLAYRDAHPEADARLVILRGLKPRGDVARRYVTTLLAKYDVPETILGLEEAVPGRKSKEEIWGDLLK